MYDNIVEKIKDLAKGVFIVETIGTIIAGIILLATYDGFILMGLLLLICGPLIAWISSLILYAFGELVEDIHAIRTKQSCSKEIAIKKETRTQYTEPTHKDKKDEYFVPNPSKLVVPQKQKDSYSCPKCGCTLKFGQKECLCSWQMDWSKYN